MENLGTGRCKRGRAQHDRSIHRYSAICNHRLRRIPPGGDASFHQQPIKANTGRVKPRLLQSFRFVCVFGGS